MFLVCWIDPGSAALGFDRCLSGPWCFLPVLVTQQAFPARVCIWSREAAAKAEAIDSYRPWCILLSKILLHRRGREWPVSEAKSAQSIPLAPTSTGWDNALGYSEPFSETLSQRVYEVWFSNFLRISVAVHRTLHLLLSQWFSSEAVAHSWALRRNLGCMALECAAVGESWGSDVITRHVLTHSTQAFPEEKQCKINPRFSSTEVLTGGLDFTGNSQALSKPLLLKNSVFFRFLATELKQLRESHSPYWSSSGCVSMEDSTVWFSPCPWCTQAHLPEELPCYPSSCGSLFIPICLSYSCPLLFSLNAKDLMKGNTQVLF